MTPMTPMTMVQSGDIGLAVYEWGEANDDRPTIVLVHGYPDSAGVWSKLAASLAAQFHVVAYDVRGAGRSSTPEAVSAYALEFLVDDLAAVVDAVSPDRPVHLMGHDWGSIQGWEAVTTERLRGRLASFTTISGPSLDHAGHWLKARLGSGSPAQTMQAMRQFMHSWYVAMFHLPAIGPGLWKQGIDRLWPTFLEKVEGIRDAEFSETQASDGAFGVNLYRANFTQRVRNPQQRFADIPVQLIVPKRDRYMVAQIWDDLLQWAPNLWRRDIDATHWVPLSHPDLLAKWLAEFVSFIEGTPENTALRRARVREGRTGKKHSGKLVVITGAGSGFGRETALLFADAGADIVAIDINADAAGNCAEAARALGAQAWARTVDVGSTAQMTALAEWVEATFGAPDVVVNNAGIGIAGSFFDTTDSDWDKVLRVNLWGVIQGSRLFGAQMIAAGKRGHIVNVASMGAFTPSRFMSAYNTSKAAVLMLSDCLRAELAEKHIRVSTICPGLSITNITRSTRFVGVSADEQTRRQQSATKLYQRRNLRPETIARAILDAVEQGHDLVPVGMEAHGSRLISRFLPALSRRLARLDVAP